MKQNYWRGWWFIVVLLVAPMTRAAEGTVPQILFVQLRIKDGAFTLVSSTNVPGSLKARRGAPVPKDYQLVLEDDSGRELTAESIEDPCLQRLEYEDPARPGVLRVQEVRRTEAEFSVRLPAKAGQRRLAIYRRAEAAAGAAPGQKASARELITRLALPDGSRP